MMDAEKRHVGRLGLARAFRSPLSGLRREGGERVPLPTPPFPPGRSGVIFNGNPDLENEELYSLEAGYAGQFTDNFSLRVDGYLQRYDELVSLANQATIPGVIDAVPINGQESFAYGTEVEAAWRHESFKLSVWYAWNEFDYDFDGPTTGGIRAYLPARHKVGVNARFRILQDLTLNANYRYTGTTRSTNPNRVSD